GLDLDRQSPLAEEAHALEKPSVGALDLRDPVEGVLGGGVATEFDGERGVRLEVIGNRFREEGAVGEERDQKSFLLRVGIDRPEILSHENVAAGEADP